MGRCKEVEKKVMAAWKDKRERAGDDMEKVLKKLKTAHEATSHLGYLLGRAVTWDEVSSSSSSSASALEMSFKLLETIRHGTEAGFSLLQAPKKGQRKQQQEIVSEGLTVNPYADGHVWKKYGEKDIKDAIFRREYYRCRDEGCAATKTVEKKYEGHPPHFWVVYKNDHTCIISTNETSKPATTVESIPCNISLEVPQLISFEQQEISNQHPEIFAPFFTPPPPPPPPAGYLREQRISNSTMRSTKQQLDLFSPFTSLEEDGLADFTTFEEYWLEQECLLKPFTPLEEDNIYTKMITPAAPSEVSSATPLVTGTSLQAMYEKTVNTLDGSLHIV